MTRLASQRNALGRSARSRVGDCEHSNDGADDDGSRTSAASADQRVALVVVGFHGDGGHGQVGAVDGYHGGLGEPGLRVVFLDCGVD